MASAIREIRGRADAPAGRFAVVVSRYNDLVTGRLAAGAEACLLQHGVAEGDIDRITVPGAWELAFAVGVAARSGAYAGIVAIGCVIRGETPHFEFVAGGATDGIGTVVATTGVPVGFGLLTTDDADQAMARAGGKHGNKGWEAALAVLELADLKQQIGAAGAGA